MLAFFGSCPAKGSPGAPAANGSGGGAAAVASRLVPTESNYDVVLKPETKVIEADIISRAYRGTATDGTLKFDVSSAPAVAALTPGAVAIFAGTALLKVTSVNAANGTVSVAGTPGASKMRFRMGTSPGPRLSISTRWCSPRRRAFIASRMNQVRCWR